MRAATARILGRVDRVVNGDEWDLKKDRRLDRAVTLALQEIVCGFRPITRESFLVAYADAHPWNQCADATNTWAMLHVRDVLAGEIDEDPIGGAS